MGTNSNETKLNNQQHLISKFKLFRPLVQNL